MKSQDRLLSIIALLIGGSYFSIFSNIGLEIPCNVLIILLSYYTLIRYNSVYPVIFLISCSRIINGFTIGISSFSLFSLLTNYLPSLIFIILNLKKFRIVKLARRKYIFLFLLLTYGYFVVNLHNAMPLFSKQVLPFSIFCIFISGIIDEKSFYNSKGMLSFLRITFLVSIVVCLLPDYDTMLDDLFKSGKAFGIPEDNGLFDFKGIFRNNGYFFDHRILGIYSTLYIYVVIRMCGRLSLVDFILSLSCLLSTTSRGAIITYLAVLLVYIYKRYHVKIARHRFQISFAIITLVIVGAFIKLSYSNKESDAANIISTFDLSSEDNALAQRSVFSLYSLNVFVQNPVLGKGLGELTAQSEKSKNVDAGGGVIYDTVSDAFLFSLLAEMGIVGFVLFVLSFWQICTGVEKDMYSIALYFALLIQMTGTDLPNMFMYYFIILLLLQHPDIKRRTAPLY